LAAKEEPPDAVASFDPKGAHDPDEEKTKIIRPPPRTPWKAAGSPPSLPDKPPETPRKPPSFGGALELALPSKLDLPPVPQGPTQQDLADRLKKAEEEINRLRGPEKVETPADKDMPSAKSLMEGVDVEHKMEESLESLAPALPGPESSTEKKEYALSLVDVAKSYYKGALEVKVLDGIDLEVRDGAFEALMGPSGSGKSTLLHLIAGLDRPTAGSIRVANADLGSMSEEQLAHWRARTIGFIFQHYNLLPALTAAQNVELPLLLRKELSRKERKERALRALRVVGLEDRVDYRPRELSGGQEQRVAIARAIVTDPKILICDEPTGDLDRKAADAVLELLVKLNREFGKTIFMVTHDPEAASRATTKRVLNKGRLA